MKVFACSDVGKIRPINEDSYYLPAPGERFCAVADGMGGHNAGEVASAMAIKVFAETMRECNLPAETALREAVEKANRVIYDAAQNSPEQRGMGTTFTALWEGDGVACIAHVGDSRAYLIRNRAILRLTTDHTLVEEMVMKGLITLQEARTHPQRNYITRALGAAERVDVDVISLELNPGDVFLLCTDGFSGTLEEKELLQNILSQPDASVALRDMMALALERGGQDNITAMLAMYEEDVE